MSQCRTYAEMHHENDNAYSNTPQCIHDFSHRNAWAIPMQEHCGFFIQAVNMLMHRVTHCQLWVLHLRILLQMWSHGQASSDSFCQDTVYLSYLARKSNPASNKQVQWMHLYRDESIKHSTCYYAFATAAHTHFGNSTRSNALSDW